MPGRKKLAFDPIDEAARQWGHSGQVSGRTEWPIS